MVKIVFGGLELTKGFSNLMKSERISGELSRTV